MPLSSRDYDLLSAYLDGDVSSDEHREVEGRLETDAEFASELAALRRTVDLVKGMPTLTALRDLRLTPAMLGEEQPVPRTEPTRYPPLRPTFRQQVLRYAPNLVAAAASFVLVVAGALTLLQPGVDAPTSAPVVALRNTESVETATAVLNEAEDDATFADPATEGADEFRDELGEAEIGRQAADDRAQTEEAADGTEDADLSMAARSAAPMGTATAAPFGTPDVLYDAAPSESQGAGALAAMPTLEVPLDTLPASDMQAPGAIDLTAAASFQLVVPTRTRAPLATATAAATAVAEAAPPQVAPYIAPEQQSVAAPQQPPVGGVVLIAAGLVIGLLALIARPRRR